MDVISPNMIWVVLTGSGAILLAVIAAAVLGRGAEERDLAGRLRSVVNPSVRIMDGQGGGSGLSALAQPFRRLGEMLRGAAIVSEKDIADFQRQIVSAGFNARVAVPTFIGVKAVLMVMMPLLGFLFATIRGFEAQGMALSVFAGIGVAVLGPNIALGMMRKPFEKKLRKGLPDALDLLVVTAEAGLGLESALDRVVKEMRHSNPAVALEFTILVQELRLLPDRREALDRFAERSGIEGFKRLAGTLSQTLRYGTPLSQALRTLAAEMRTERMLAIEEKAIRLPALLVIPLIVFIMP
ncbi:MAG: type II secretion system F family protein, partial [Acetobacteraceae bacterium]|nr:type II secretion system F family protein [Acetobacteraceae bacterium]